MSKNDRLQIEQDEGQLNITIRAYKDEKKQKLLGVWVALWSLAGIAICSQLFLNYSGQEKIFMVIWLAFWAYFEFKVVKAFRWRKEGREIIKMNDETLVYYREIGGRGLPNKFNLDFVTSIDRFEGEKNQFSKVMNDSYWVIAGEKLVIEAGGKLHPFGLRLGKNEKNKVLKAMQHHLKEHQKRSEF